MSYRGTRPTPRRDRWQGRPSDLAVVALIVILGVILAGSFLWGVTHELPTEADLRPTAKITHDSLGPTYTYDGEVIRWYVFVDPDTQEQYLVNDRGGCTPRLGGQDELEEMETYE